MSKLIVSPGNWKITKYGTICRSWNIISVDPIFMDSLLLVGGHLEFTNLALNCHSKIVM